MIVGEFPSFSLVGWLTCLLLIDAVVGMRLSRCEQTTFSLAGSILVQLEFVGVFNGGFLYIVLALVF